MVIKERFKFFYPSTTITAEVMTTESPTVDAAVSRVKEFREIYSRCRLMFQDLFNMSLLKTSLVFKVDR